MAIADRWKFDYVNNRMYRDTAVEPTVVDSVNAVYSLAMDTFDELAQMDNPVPMRALTPTEYEMINGWFIDDESIKYLDGGAIKTVGYTNEIQVLTLAAAGYVDCVATDIGKTVTDDGVDTGPLLAYDNTLRKWWIRWGTTIADGSAMAITAGTGAGTAEGDSVTGEDLYANVYTLGTIADDPYAQVYIFQAGEAIAEWSDLPNWDRGHIDVLIKVMEADVEIDEAVITVFTRQYGDLFDHYEIDLSAGGRNAVPIATAVDLDNPTGEWHLFFDAKTADFVVNGILTGATSGATAEIISVTDWTETVNTGVLTLGGIKGTFQDNEIITGSLGGSATVNGTIGDTYLKYDALTAAFAVGSILTGVTSGAKRKIRGIQADAGAVGKLCLEADVDYETDSAYYLAFQDNEQLWADNIALWAASTAYALGDFVRPTTPTGFIYECTTAGTSGATEPTWDTTEGGTTTDGTVVWTTRVQARADGASTTIVAGYRDIGVWFMNGTLEVADNTTFTVGLTLTGATSGDTGIILEKDANGTTLRLANITGPFQDGETVTDTDVGTSTVTSTLIPVPTMTKAFEAALPKPYNIIVECRTRPVAEVYEYFKYLCREDSVFLMYKLDSKALQGAVADDGGVQTDETTEANNPTANDMTLLPAVPAVDDAYYFGGLAQFFKLQLNVGTAGDGVWTIIWEYWNGSIWAALADVVDGTNAFRNAGSNDVSFSVPTDWATTSVLGITAYWIRARVSAYTSIVTQPLGTQAWLWATPTVLDGEEYIIAFEGYAPKKASPLATFAGGVLFGARGLWIENMATADVRNYTLIDADGVKQDPPNKQPLRVTALVAGDRVCIFQTTAGEIEKAMYTSHPTNNTTGLTTFEVQEALPVDTPASGVIRVVDATDLSEQRYTYTSWSGSIFSGLSPALDRDYDGTDTVYVPFIDGEATTDYIEKVCIYTADRPILTRVRKKGIIPFEIAGTYVATGYIVAAIRTTDAIVT